MVRLSVKLAARRQETTYQADGLYDESDEYAQVYIHITFPTTRHSLIET